MTVLPVRVFPDPILRKKSRTVKRFDSALRTLARDMVETMRRANGVGLAAQQIGDLRRIAVIQVPEQEPITLVNPEITHREGTEEMTEGCLSVPGYYGLVPRATVVRLRAQDESGKRYTLTAEGLLAQAVQHEVGHLDGGLYLDHLVSHDSLRRTGYLPGSPAWAEHGYPVYPHRTPGLPADAELVRALDAAARHP